MKKRWFFTGAAAALAALFLGCVLAVGKSTQWFGLEQLAKGSSPQWTYERQVTWDPSLSSVEGIRIAWGDGPVYVKPCEGTMITVTEYASRPLEEEEFFQMTSSGGVLEIQWDHSLLPLSVFQGLEKQLEVEVPREVLSHLEEFSCGNATGNVDVSDITAQEVNITSAAGDLSLLSLQGEKVHLSTVSGEVQWTQGKAENLSLETTSGGVKLYQVQTGVCGVSTVTGDVNFSGQGQELSVETISGQVYLDLSAGLKEADLRSVSGLLSLALPQEEGFQAAYSTMSGKFRSDFTGAEEKGTFLYRTGGADIQFTTTSGDMMVRKSDKT